MPMVLKMDMADILETGAAFSHEKNLRNSVSEGNIFYHLVFAGRA